MAKRRTHKQPFTHHVLRLWLKFLSLVKGLTTLFSLLMCPIGMTFLIYNTFISFDFYRAFIGCAILIVMPYLNIKIQGVE